MGQLSMIFTIPVAKSWALTLSYPQAKCWKSAKTHTPAPHLAALVEPPSGMVASNGVRHLGTVGTTL